MKRALGAVAQKMIEHELLVNSPQEDNWALADKFGVQAIPQMLIVETEESFNQLQPMTLIGESEEDVPEGTQKVDVLAELSGIHTPETYYAFIRSSLKIDTEDSESEN